MRGIKVVSRKSRQQVVTMILEICGRLSDSRGLFKYRAD